MKRFFKNSIVSFLVMMFIIPSTFAFMPQKAEAQAGRASSCVYGWIKAYVSKTADHISGVASVPGQQTGDQQHTSTAAGEESNNFNNCILYPAAKLMVVSLIRQIGSSVVNWVNSGFEGKPLFVTDFAGTIRNAADDALGQFIEGSDLSFLCSSFSLQIRIALAMKYSQPWSKKSQCTLTQIKQNVDNFVQNNGGAGWDNWLQLTKDPQNNWVGAYYMADSELAQRMMGAAGVKQQKIAYNAGWLDFEQCDQWTPAAEGQTYDITSTTQNADYFSTGKLDTSTTQAKAVNVNGSSTSYLSTGDTRMYGSNTIRTNDNGTKDVCTKKSTATPGSVIAGKINSTFAQGDIQQAVAQEIDDVIAATLNQLTTMLMTKGLAALSGKKSSSNMSYSDKYAQTYWGAQQASSTQTTDTGSQSEMDKYVNEASNPAAVQNLINTNPDTQAILQYTNQAAQNGYNNQQQLENNLNQQLTGIVDASEQNIALGKAATQSTTDNPASNAVNGLTDESATSYSKPASTHQVTADESILSGNIGDVRPWWQVDLGKTSKITEVRVYPVKGKPVTGTLETFTVSLSDGLDGSWTSDPIVATETYPIKIKTPTTGSWQYVRITKNAQKDEQCYRNTSSDSYSTQYATCYHALELAEVQVIAPTTTVIPTNNNNSGTTTLSWSSSNDNVSVVKGNLVSFIQTLGGANKSGLTVTTTLYSDSKPITFASLFSVLTIGWGNGTSVSNQMTFDSSMTHGALKLTNVSTTNTSSFFLKYSGLSKIAAPSGTYRVEAVVTDSVGNNLGTLSTQFVIQ